MDLDDLFTDLPKDAPPVVGRPPENVGLVSIGQRKETCRGCSDCPEGCWHQWAYTWKEPWETCGKFLAAERHHLIYGKCPLGRWDIARSFHLPSVKTFVYTTPWQTGRHERVKRLLDGYGFTAWKFFFGTQPDTTGYRDGWGRGKDYWAFIPKDHAKLLREHEPPLLIFEDDISPRDFRPTVTLPAGAEVAMLGGGRGGDWRGVNAAAQSGGSWYRAYRYAYQPVNADWMRVAGMWFTHAILHVDRRIMLEMADWWERVNRPIDTTLAREAWRWNLVCRRVPMFWQDDGKHRRDTYDYAPTQYGLAMTPPRAQTLREERQRLLRGRRPVLTRDAG